MELKDTIDLMNSPDYKERFKAEYMQVKIRYEKLKSFCNKIEAAEIIDFDCLFLHLTAKAHFMPTKAA